MRLALVFDAPRSGGPPLSTGVGGAYASRVIEACRAASGVADLEVETFYGVDSIQPGGKAPPIALIRQERERLYRELQAWRPDRVLSVGAAALNSMADDSKKALAISKERGRMRLWYGVPWLPTISHMAVVIHSDLHRDFSSDVYKVLAQAAPLPPMSIDLVVPESLYELEAELEYLDEASVVGVDVETTGLRPAVDDLLAVGIGAVYDDLSGLAVVVTKELLKEPGIEDVLWDAVWRRTRRSVGHNFKFDMQYLAPVVGWPPDDALLGDTLLMGHLLDERPNRPSSRVRGLGLKDMVAVRYDHKYGFDFNSFYEETRAAHEGESQDEFKVRIADLFDHMHSYLGEDVCYTARLWHDLKTEADAESPRLARAHDDLLMPVSKAIARAEFAGAPVNVAWVEETVAAYDARAVRLEAALLKALVPLTPRDVSTMKITSPQQIADVMYDDWKMTPDVRRHGKLPKDDRSTDKDHIASAVSKYVGTKLDRQARWLRALQRLRREVRQRTTYQKSLLDRVDPDGRVRASFLIHGTSTGRLSATGPAIQTIPSIDREDAILYRPMRRAFAPVPPSLWVEVDYSQLELRVAAALSGDEALTQVFKSGRDIHQEIASAIFSKPYDEVLKAERFMAKAVSFGIVYGRGGDALATGKEMAYVVQRLGMKPWSPEQADTFIRKFLRDYPRLAEWIGELHATVPKAGYVESPFGRRRRFPLYPSRRGELGAIERQAVNTPVQSAASDICLEAMVALTEFIEVHDLDSRVLFTVHDSICLEVPDHEAGGMEEVCKEIMEKDFMGVPLTVDYESGPTWADVKEHTAEETEEHVMKHSGLSRALGHS